MNHLVFNGKDFADFSAQITESTFLKGAERDVTTFSVLGRNGVLIADNNRYKPVSLVTKLAVKNNMQSNMEAMRSFLSSCTGFCRYEESQVPNEFRLASFYKEFNPDQYDHIGGTVTLGFTAQPQRYLKQGEIPITFTADGSLLNPTSQEALPLIKVTGTGSFGIGNLTVTITQHSLDHIMIDCEAMLIYCGAVQASEYVTMTNHEFPALSTGQTGITVNGVTLEITPRWFNI